MLQCTKNKLTMCKIILIAIGLLVVISLCLFFYSLYTAPLVDDNERIIKIN